MKIMNKIVATIATFSMIASLAITASASFSSVTLTPEANEIKAGESVTIDTTWDTLVGAKGLSIKVFYDNTVFSVDSSNNTAYNFGTTLKKSYLPNFIASDFVASRHNYMKNEEVDENFNITTMFPGLTPNDAGTYVAYVFADTSGETVIDEETESYATNNTLGTIFTAKADAEPGTYTFTVEMASSDATAGVITKTATATVKIAGDEPKTTLGNAVAGNDMYGQKTIAAGISFATGSESKATVTLMNGDAEVKSKEYSLPGSGVAGGTTNLVGIIRYNPEDVTAGNAFKLTVGEASTTAAIN